MFGQAAGGVLGDLFGWRNVFFILGAMFALATVGLIYELFTNPRTRAAGRPEETSRGFVADYKAVLSNRWARIVIVAVFIESVFGWGAFAYVGADLNQRFGLGFTAVGLIVGSFAIGGLVYTATVQQLVNRFGQRGLAIGGALMCGIAYLMLASGAAWWLAPIAVAMIGLGFYALHNTLQTNGTQMTPQARATGFALFSSAIYVGQTVGVGVGAFVFDRAGAVPLFVVTAIVLPVMALWFARELKQRRELLGEQIIISDQVRPRETRSISARTSRSTRPGRLSSSQVLSSGRSISRTRSSSVRAFCTSTVWASVLNAESTAAVVDDEISGRCGSANRLTGADSGHFRHRVDSVAGSEAAVPRVIASVRSRTSAPAMAPWRQRPASSRGRPAASPARPAAEWRQPDVAARAAAAPWAAAAAASDRGLRRRFCRCRRRR